MTEDFDHSRPDGLAGLAGAPGPRGKPFTLPPMPTFVVVPEADEFLKRGDFEGAARVIDAGLAEIEAARRRAKLALLETGLKIDILRRDAKSAAKRIQKMVEDDLPPGIARGKKEQIEQNTWHAYWHMWQSDFYTDVALALVRANAAKETTQNGGAHTTST